MIIFTTENLPVPVRLVLDGADLPPVITRGWKVRKTVTKYAGDLTTVQVHGLDMSPVSMSGEFDDGEFGTPGHTGRQIQALRALSSSGALVRFEWQDVQLWGVFSGDIEQRTADLSRYRITFEPYWAINPDYIPFLDKPIPVAEMPVTLTDQMDEILRLANAPPPGLDLSFVQGLLLDIYGAQAKLTAVLIPLDTVGDYAELTAETVRRANRAIYGSVVALERVVSRISGANIFTLSASPVSAISGDAYTSQIRARSRALQADNLATMRSLLNAVRPVRQRQHTVADGDTLVRLATRYLGTFDRWVEIAEANDLDTSALVTGQILDIPPR